MCTQEIAINIFVSDAYIFFPAFAVHFAFALYRPAVFLFRPVSKAPPSPSVRVTASVTADWPGQEGLP
jgi:hypothetical protein